MNPDLKNDYFEDGVDRILRLMKDTFGPQFKQYYNGEIINPPASLLPCIMVTETKSDINTDATGFDVIQEEIIIIVVLNLNDYTGGSSETVLADYALRKLVQAQDPTTKQYIAESVLGAIRTHFTMDSDTLYNSCQIDFTPSQRGTAADVINTQEAYITITMQRLVPVPSRT